MRIKILIRNNHVCIIHPQTFWVWMPRNYTYFKHEILHLFQRAHISMIIPKGTCGLISLHVPRETKQCNLAPTVHNRCPSRMLCQNLLTNTCVPLIAWLSCFPGFSQNTFSKRVRSCINFYSAMEDMQHHFGHIYWLKASSRSAQI